MKETDIIILTINCGSSSIKYSLYDWTLKSAITIGIVERIGLPHTLIKQENSTGKIYKKEIDCSDYYSAMQIILKTLTDEENGVIKDLSIIKGCGHRVVHGGEQFKQSVLIDGLDGEVVKTLKKLVPLAPLHNPANIAGIECALKLLPNIPHIAIMDTSFLQTMPDYVYLYALPYEWYYKYGVRKYGFHGTSHFYVSRRAAVMLSKNIQDCNLITCHIGNGVSITAIKQGMAFDHSMGFTPLEGLIMGTRCGDIDATIVTYIAERMKIDCKQVISILNKESGLLGITGKYTDRRDILKAADSGDLRAKLAIEMECYRIKKYIGAYTAALGRVDAIVWTAGAGELAYKIREKSLENLENIGIKLDPELNRTAVSRNHEFVISCKDSKIKVLVIPTNEELVMVEDVVKFLLKQETGYKYSFESLSYRDLHRDAAYEKEKQLFQSFNITEK